MRTPIAVVPVVSLPRVAQVATAVMIGAVEGLLFWRFGLTVTLLSYGYFGAIAVVLGATDLATHKLPNSITLPSYPIALGLLALASGVEDDWSSFVRAVVAMIVVGVGFLVLAFATGGQAGLGDVKLSMLVGLYDGWMSWSAVLVAVLAGFLLAAFWGLPMAVRKRELHYRFAFGPFLLAGAFVAVLVR
jgi:leader peptidase (prepilin peptidase)/N-methyltransferase